MYIYEALVLILASTLFGSIIGSVPSLFFFFSCCCLTCLCPLLRAGFLAGVSLTAQFNLFLDLPFTFSFPYVLYFSVFGMSLVVALLGSYLPARTLRGKQIAHVIKGL